jgi:MarR family transcriptional regulator for hemolysin
MDGSVISEAVDQFGPRLAELARMWRGEIDRQLKPLGMSDARWRTLRHLWRGGGGLMQNDLAVRLGIRGSTLVRQLDLLEADGWIERRDSPDDRRVKTIHLTPKSGPLLDRMEEVIRGLRHQVLSGLDEQDLRICMAVFEHIRGRLEDVVPISQESQPAT